MARKQRIAHIDGIAASGTAHGVLIEAPADASGSVVSVTITGADGVKRHASSIVTGDQIDELIRALIAVRGGAWLDVLTAHDKKASK